jgi:hypothetical protein
MEGTSAHRGFVREKKSIPIALGAVARARNEARNFEVIVIGDAAGQECDKGEKRAILSPIRQRVTEGVAPTAIIGMAATGLPVGSSKRCDIPHVVKDGVTDLLAEEQGVAGLAGAEAERQRSVRLSRAATSSTIL